MASIFLSDDIVKRLEAAAQRENLTVSELLTDMLDQHILRTASQDEADAAFKSIIGIYDDDVNNMSTTVRETLQKYFQDKYGDPD